MRRKIYFFLGVTEEHWGDPWFLAPPDTPWIF